MWCTASLSLITLITEQFVQLWLFYGEGLFLFSTVTSKHVLSETGLMLYWPIPACPTIHDIRINSITPQIFSMQRIYKTQTHTYECMHADKHGRAHVDHDGLSLVEGRGISQIVKWSSALKSCTSWIELSETNQDSFDPAELHAPSFGFLRCQSRRLLGCWRLLTIGHTILKRLLTANHSHREEKDVWREKAAELR